jgi:hydrogenase nickel incorporation protein HypA/HybF
MHELTIVSEMLEKIEKIKLEQNWNHIQHVQIVIGPLSGVERGSIEACFELLTHEWTVPPKLEIVIDPIAFHCFKCNDISLLEQPELICTHCGSTEGAMTGGRSLYFSEMEGE